MRSPGWLLCGDLPPREHGRPTKVVICLFRKRLHVDYSGICTHYFYMDMQKRLLLPVCGECAGMYAWAIMPENDSAVTISQFSLLV